LKRSLPAAPIDREYGFVRWNLNEHVQALIRSRQPTDLGALRDPDTRLVSPLVEPAKR
jgi:hypothetical protein